MKSYLYSISPEIWQVVCDGVDFLEDDEEPTPEQLEKIHRNAQAITIFNSSLNKEGFNRVDGLKEAKDVWTTLRHCPTECLCLTFSLSVYRTKF
jgi:hypothetical protein